MMIVVMVRTLLVPLPRSIAQWLWRRWLPTNNLMPLKVLSAAVVAAPLPILRKRSSLRRDRAQM